jgi:hypothetical protein
MSLLKLNIYIDTDTPHRMQRELGESILCYPGDITYLTLIFQIGDFASVHLTLLAYSHNP